MKRNLLLFLGVFAVSLLVSCDKEEKTEEPLSDQIAIINITSFTANVSGSIDGISSNDMLSGTCGVLYSNEMNAVDAFNSWAEGNDNADCQIYSRARVNSDGSLTSQIERLKPETTYSYCLFYKSKSGKKRAISSTGSFTTKPFNPEVITADAAEVGYFNAKINGQIKVDAEDLKLCKTGIMLSDNRNDLPAGTVFDANDIASDGSFTASFSKLNHSTDYYYRTYLYVEHVDYKSYGEIKSVQTRNVDEMAVDMGLSVKWASCDFMAQTPDEDGECYAWGMNKSFRKGSLDNYTYYSNGSYIDIGQSICGNPDYDVVTQVYGGKWRMPSDSEVKELFDNCTLEPLQSDGYGNATSLLFKAKNGASFKMNVMSLRYTASAQTSTNKAAMRWTGTMSETDDGKAYVFQTGELKYLPLTTNRYEELCIRPVCDY